MTTESISVHLRPPNPRWFIDSFHLKPAESRNIRFVYVLISCNSAILTTILGRQKISLARHTRRCSCQLPTSREYHRGSPSPVPTAAPGHPSCGVGPGWTRNGLSAVAWAATLPLAYVRIHPSLLRAETFMTFTWKKKPRISVAGQGRQSFATSRNTKESKPRYRGPDIDKNSVITTTTYGPVSIVLQNLKQGRSIENQSRDHFPHSIAKRKLSD